MHFHSFSPPIEIYYILVLSTTTAATSLELSAGIPTNANAMESHNDHSSNANQEQAQS